MWDRPQLGGEQRPADPTELSAVHVRMPRPTRLAVPVSADKKTAAALERLGVQSLQDLFEHAPSAHSDRSLTAIADIEDGAEVTLFGTLTAIRQSPVRRRRFSVVEGQLADDSGEVKLVWFNQRWLAERLEPGSDLRVFGKVAKGALQVREYSIVAGASQAQSDGAGLVAVYPSTEGLKPQKVRQLVERQLRQAAFEVVDPLPGRLLAAKRMPSRGDALAALHFSNEVSDAAVGRTRLAFEELFLQQLALTMIRRARRTSSHAPQLVGSEHDLIAPWLAALPFQLTPAQRIAIDAIFADLADARPMQRLLMGEVGSGKTVCALAAMIRTVESGYQAALMAPTETLAEQHFQTINALLPQTPLALLTGSTSAARRRELLSRLASGELGMIVGTHALIEPTVEFQSLGLAVVDEQHRFGVRQRAALDAKGSADLVPHVLHMTATPIPRTLALAAFGDLDLTSIRDLPHGRKPVRTTVASEARRPAAYEYVRTRLLEGRQAYVVCPLVEQSEALEARAASAEAERLAATEFRDFNVGLIHGQLSSKQKAEAMGSFVSGDTDILVATSVIEVGIDVANAAVMIVEDAERYGLSQLHQLRGRIGRGEHESDCILFGSAKSARLKALVGNADGFELARIDLELRGRGEQLGTRQHGLPRYRFAELPLDAGLLETANAEARAILANDPDLARPEHALLHAAVADTDKTGLTKIHG